MFTVHLEDDKIGNLWKVHWNMKRKTKYNELLKIGESELWVKWSKNYLNTPSRDFNSYVSLIFCENSIGLSRIALSEGKVGWQMLPSVFMLFWRTAVTVYLYDSPMIMLGTNINFGEWIQIEQSSWLLTRRKQDPLPSNHNRIEIESQLFQMSIKYAVSFLNYWRYFI